MMKKPLLFILALFFIGTFCKAQPFTDITASCPYVEIGVISIDGKKDANYSADIEFLGFNGSNQPDDEYDLSGTFRIAWSEEGFYLFVHVMDDLYDLAEEDEWLQSLYKYDNLEIFFNTDLDNDAEDGTREPEDKQIRHSVGYTQDGRNLSANVIPDEVWMFDLKDGEYTFETFIPWVAITSSGFSIDAEMEIGFTINVGDSDAPGGNRDLIMLWAGAGEADNQWKDTRYYGFVTLSGESVKNSIASVAENKMLVYPNPCKDQVITQNASSEMLLMNSKGQILKIINCNTTSIDMSSITPGVYFIQSENKLQKLFKQ